MVSPSRARVLGALLLAMLTGACGGPERPLNMGFKEIPSDVVLGDQTAATVPAGESSDGGAPVFNLPPSIVALPPPRFDSVPRPVSAPPARPPCPTADPLQAPALEAPSTIDAPPAAGTYFFRNKGDYNVSGANPRRGAFPPMSFRTVKTTFQSGDGRVFDFTVAETLLDTTTTTTYRVVRAADIGGAAEGTAEAGLYIRHIETRSSEGETAAFTPTPELRLAALPLVRGARVEARGVDPTTATTMAFASTVAGKSRVDACGEPLDSFTLELTEGRLIAPQQDLQFAATYAVGTQFGGLVLRDTVAFTGTDGDAGVSRTNTSTISQVPARPGR